MNTIKLICNQCHKTYWTDRRRTLAIQETMKKDPDFLNKYICKGCRDGIVKVESKAKEQVKVELPMPVISDDLKEFIPPASEKYFNRWFGSEKNKVKDEDVLMFHYKATNRLLKNVLFIGESGTGKTLLLRHFCHKNKIPYYRLVMNAGTTNEDIIGQQVMEEDGKFRFAYQVLIKFMQKGGIFVFDEINAGQKEILHILNSITDFERKAIVTQHKGEVIEAVDNFLVVACMNPPDEYDLQEMSKSLKSRFIPYYFGFDERIDKLVLKDNKLVEFANNIRIARLNRKIDTPLTTRDLVHFKLLREGLGYEIAKEMLVNKFHNGEKEVVRTSIETYLEKSKILDKETKTEATTQ